MFPKHISQLNHLRSNPMVKFKEEIVAGNKFTIVSYMIGNKELWDDPLARECRGITYDENGDCVAATMHKFFNVGEREETQPNALPWDRPYQVFEKRDGSMVTPVLVNDKVFWKTKKSFYSDVAIKANQCASADLNVRAKLWLSYGITPTYEFTHPDHRIVIDYGQSPEFKLLALRDTKTGDYIEPMQYGVSQFNKTLDDLKNDVSTLQDFEGYVVRFANGTWVKWKTEHYLSLHHLMTEVRARDVADAVIDETVDDIKSLASSKGIDLKEIEIIEDIVTDQLATIEMATVKLWKKILLETTRKDAAMKYKSEEHFGLAMKMFDGASPDYVGFWKRKYRETFPLKTLFSDFSVRDEA